MQAPHVRFAILDFANGCRDERWRLGLDARKIEGQTAGELAACDLLGVVEKQYAPSI